jgi:hypothetical protein
MVVSSSRNKGGKRRQKAAGGGGWRRVELGKVRVIQIVSVIGGWLWTKRESGSGQNSGTLAVVRSSKEMKRVKRRVLAV